MNPSTTNAEPANLLGKLKGIWPKFTFGLVAGILSFLIATPYLLVNGSDDIPAFATTAQAWLTAAVFIVTSLLGMLVGFLISRLVRNRWLFDLSLSLTTLCVVLGDCVSVRSLMREGATQAQITGSWAALGAWGAGALGIGMLVPGLVKKLKGPLPHSEDITPLVAVGLLSLVISLGAAIGYSLSLYTWLPNYAGGHVARVVQFNWSSNFSGTLEQSGNKTEPVELIYDDGDRYWVKHVDHDSRAVYVTTTLDKNKSQISYAGDHPEIEQPLERPLEWSLTFQPKDN